MFFCRRQWVSCFIILSISKVFAQDYIWPTDANKIITSTFGEYRAGHFHAGIDIKTLPRSGYKVFAIEDGSVSQVIVSPYGHGRAVFIQLNNGMQAVFSHLSRFSDPIEKLIREEQKKRCRFAVEKIFSPGAFPVKKGDLLGYTGRSGTRDPHLHFEIRDSENCPVNPLLFGYIINDCIPPTMQAVAVTPLSFGSHVNGDFLPEQFSLIKKSDRLYLLDGVIKIWGRVGFSLSAFDRADGGANRFAVYRIKLFIDDKNVFTATYDTFPMRLTQQVHLDRDYRLYKWGWGLFQKLYMDACNELPFYSPAHQEAGILCCWNGNEQKSRLQNLWSSSAENIDSPVFLNDGEHSFRIEASDFSGNTTEIRGTLCMVPLSEMWAQSISRNSLEGLEPKVQGIVPEISVDIKFFEEAARFYVSSDRPLSGIPNLFVGMESSLKNIVPLIPKSSQEFVGIYPWEEGVTGEMITEIRFMDYSGNERGTQDTLCLFGITPKKGGAIISADKRCSVIFPKESIYGSIVGTCEEKPFLHPKGVINKQYLIFPQDIALKGRVEIKIEIPCTPDKGKKLAMYRITPQGNVVYVGGGWEKGAVYARTRSFSGFTVLKDDEPPEIGFVYPGQGATIRDRTPCIRFEFHDNLSGIYGEDNYMLFLDNMRMIVEYDPVKNIGIHQVFDRLDAGRHDLKIVIKDKAGNSAEMKTWFRIK